MTCNALNSSSEYLWLFLSAMGIGLTGGTLIRSFLLKYRYARRHTKIAGPVRGVFQPVVQISLYLSISAGSVLGAVFFLDLPSVPWSRMHLFFFLISAGVWLIVRAGLRYLLIPAAALLIAYVVLVSQLCVQWSGVSSEQPLIRGRILSRQDERLAVELVLPDQEVALYPEIEGEELRYSFDVIEFREWSFYPNSTRMYRFVEVAAGDDPEPEPLHVPLSIRFLARARLLEYRHITASQTEIVILRPYGIYSDPRSDALAIRFD